MIDEINNIIYGNSRTGTNKIFIFKDPKIEEYKKGPLIQSLLFLEECQHGFGSDYSKDVRFSTIIDAIESAFCLKKNV